MKRAAIILPNQLVKNTGHLPADAGIFLVEETLFFNQYNFHKQKLLFHRASMKFYESYLKDLGYEVHYIEARETLSDIRKLIQRLEAEQVSELHVLDPVDNWLEKRIRDSVKYSKLVWYENPLFLNSKAQLQSFFKSTKKKYFQTAFYKEQRQQRHVLMEGGQPAGGQWTFDSENRKRYPKDKTPPHIQFPETTAIYTAACTYVADYFPDNQGEISPYPLYPINFEQAGQWLQQFLETRFYAFGDYEDAIVRDASFLNHSVLSPLLNTGLLTVDEVMEHALDFAGQADIPINSLEGFVRQLLGWREFIRGIYRVQGSRQRTSNFWNHHAAIPESLYNGSTGIIPVDHSIKKVLKTGYVHHIERLMVLSNFMVLCEFEPDAVYRWFMELFIDAYDWVMVPNVYGMSLFADGGLMSTKPYISSSNYLKKMSDYPGGEWEFIWDGLFWRFMDKHRDFFSKNPRMGMLIKNFDKMDSGKRQELLEKAENFLATLHKNI